MPKGDPDKVYLIELAEKINRKPNTIRIWERNGILPKKLVPKRDDRGWRYWTPKQVEDMKVWMEREHVGPGRGFAVIHGKV